MYKKLLIPVLFIIVTIFSITLYSCKSANFEVNKLVVEPTEALTGESVVVTVDVSNTGGDEGTYSVVLLVNGVDELSKEITMAPGNSEAVQFLVSKDAPGTYNIKVAELNTTLTVITLDQLLEKTAEAMSALDSYHFYYAIDLEISISEDSFSFFEDME